ncbi:MAG: sporulation protein YabP [Clostridia bacterium]|nr:sporulation protein YabP [Clostridia bacterium]
MAEKAVCTHSLCMEGRSRAVITGVVDVECFSGDMAVVSTSQGDMTICGANLKVARLDIQAGEVEIEGQIDSIDYGAAKKGGFFGRLFR